MNYERTQITYTSIKHLSALPFLTELNLRHISGHNSHAARLEIKKLFPRYQKLTKLIQTIELRYQKQGAEKEVNSGKC